MSEICTPIEPLPEGVRYTPGPDEYLITQVHSISDLLRFCIEQGETVEGLRFLLENME